MAATTVVSAAYDTSGNGGRKLVKLSNGWLVSLSVNTSGSQIVFHISKDNGTTWQQLTTVPYSNTYIGAAMVCKDNYIYALIGDSANMKVAKFDATLTSPSPSITFIDSGQSSYGSGVSLAINATGTELHAAWASKNSTYPNSFNIRYAKGTINGNGNVSWGSVTQISTATGGFNQNPCIVVKGDGNPFIAYEGYNGSTYYTQYYRFSGSSWVASGGYNGGSYAQYIPCAVVDGNGVIHVVWQGTDSTDTSTQNIRYSKSADGGVTWSAVTKLTTGNTNAYHQQCPVISADKNNNLYVLWEGPDNSVSGGYYQIKRRIYTGGTWVATTVLTNNTTGHAQYASIMEKETGSTIGWIWKDGQASAVKFDSITLNASPTLSLTSPADNLSLAEGNSLPIEGAATDQDVNDPVTIYLQVNNGTQVAIHSGVSDGSTAISFAKQLEYRNKRIFYGTTDLTGADLAENTDHILKVWAEDNKSGKSAVETRPFRVIWNRPPTISGENGDLGIYEETPVVSYIVTDPEGNGFTVTEKINGTLIRSFTGVPGQEETLEIPFDTWLRLEPGVQHTLTIEATDTQGATSVRTYTLKRFEDEIYFEIEEPWPTDAAAKRVLLTLDMTLPAGAVLTAEACNNAFDDSPEWEDISFYARYARGYVFLNDQKTAENWGVSIRVRIQKGTATEPIEIKGFGGAFD